MEPGTRAAPGNGGGALSVIIPCYNEQERLPESLLRVRDYVAARYPEFEILVVDDGSSDETVATAQRLAGDDRRIRVLPYKPNRGKGYAVRHGAAAAVGDTVLFTDADLSTPIEELGKMAPFLAQGYDVVIGSRAIAGSNLARRQPWLRERIGRTFNLAIRMLGVREIHDSQCGFKLFSRRAARDIFRVLTIDRWAFDVEALVVASLLDYKIREVPVTWVNSPQSKVNVMRDAARTVGDLIRIRLTWMRRRPVRSSATEETAPAR